MRIVLRRDLCSGHGRCYALAPDVYQPDEVGYCDPAYDIVPVELHELARLGATNCPEDAISLVEDGDPGTGGPDSEQRHPVSHRGELP